MLSNSALSFAVKQTTCLLSVAEVKYFFTVRKKTTCHRERGCTRKKQHTEMGSPEGTTKHPHNWRISQRQLSKLDTLLCTLGFTRKSGETHWPHLLPWEHRQSCRLLYNQSACWGPGAPFQTPGGSSHSTSLSLLLFPNPVDTVACFIVGKEQFLYHSLPKAKSYFYDAFYS